jgi:hypothetical protein
MAAKAIKLDSKLGTDIETGALANGTTKIGFIRKLIKEKNEVEQLKKELLSLQEKFRQREEKAKNVGGGFTELQSAKFDLLCVEVATILHGSVSGFDTAYGARKEKIKKLQETVLKLEKK